jgi:16S rRNA (uracil1498-N3)-methyltransferase
MTTRPPVGAPAGPFPEVVSAEFTGFVRANDPVAARSAKTSQSLGVAGRFCPKVLLVHFIHVNIILFRHSEVELPLPRSDSRAHHLLSVLRRQPGDSFDAGVLNGPRGKGSLLAIEKDFLRLAFAWDKPSEPPDPLVLVIGLPRPQTARDLLREAASLGVAAMHFVRTEKGEASYADSTLWRSGDWEECVINGAAQAFSTRIPEVTHGRPLADALAALPVGNSRVALDNYEATAPLSQMPLPAGRPVVLAVGSERGWSANERVLLRQQGFAFAHLGQRVLRTETACIAAVTLVRAKCGWI